MALAQGTRLGPYEIQSPLGAGGMGEVYRAVDTRLNRTVAVKILSKMLAETAESRARFECEARKHVGRASEFGGLGSMLISPGKHRIKVGLPGYRTFETEINLLARQKSEVKTELVKGSIQQASPEIKHPL